MNDKELELVKALADKLDTTAAHLWQVMIRQAFISGVLNLVACVIALALLGCLWRVTIVKTRSGEDWHGDIEPWWFLVAVMSLIVTALIGVLSGSIVTALLNPEYWALMQLIH